MREMTLEEMAMVTGGYYDNVEEIVVTGKKWESASVGGKLMIGLSAQDIANLKQEGIATISVDDKIPDEGIPLLVITAEKTNPPNNYLSSVLDCFNANWANNLTAGMILGGVSGAWSFGVLGAASSLGLLGAPAAVAGGAMGAAAGALTSVPSTALVCAVLPRGAAIGESNSLR